MTESFDSFQSEYPVVIELPVQWGEMDAFRHVNNVVYFRYFESVRIAYMSRTSMFKATDSERLFPVLAATECQYKKPLTFPDRIKVGCRVAEIFDKGFLQEYAIFSCTQESITTFGSGRIVLLSATGAQVALSEQLKSEIDAIERRQ